MRLNKRSFFSLSLLVLILLAATVVPAMAKPLSDDHFLWPDDVLGFVREWRSTAREVEPSKVRSKASMAAVTDKKTGVLY